MIPNLGDAMKINSISFLLFFGASLIQYGCGNGKEPETNRNNDPAEKRIFLNDSELKKDPNRSFFLFRGNPIPIKKFGETDIISNAPMRINETVLQFMSSSLYLIVNSRIRRPIPTYGFLWKEIQTVKRSAPVLGNSKFVQAFSSSQC